MGTRGSTRPTRRPVCHASASAVPSTQRLPQLWPAAALGAGGEQKCQVTPPPIPRQGPPGWGPAQLSKGCQQAVVGQCHNRAGGTGLALVPEQTRLSRQQERWVCVPIPSRGHPRKAMLLMSPHLLQGRSWCQGGSSSSWELPQCATVIPTRTLLIQLPWLGSSCHVLGGTGVSHQCGCKPPHRPGIHPLPGQARTQAAHPEPGASREGASPGETRPSHTNAQTCVH